MSLTLILPTYCHRVILMACRSQGLLTLLRIYASLHFHYQQSISNHHNLNGCNCIHSCPVQPIVYSAFKAMYANTNLTHFFSDLKPVSNFPQLPDSMSRRKLHDLFLLPSSSCPASLSLQFSQLLPSMKALVFTLSPLTCFGLCVCCLSSLQNSFCPFIGRASANYLLFKHQFSDSMSFSQVSFFSLMK